jgi:PAS domain S-box-containing protein
LAEDKKAQIKEAIRQLHAGVPPDQVKEKFRHVLESTDSLEIAKIEEELAKEGMKREEMRKLCDVHMAIFKEQLEKQQPNLQPTQPISILMEEHKIMLKLADQLATAANKMLKVTDMRYVTAEIHEVEHLAEDFTDSEKHYLREENVLFPLIEKHGITEPPAVMWMEHNEIRELKKKLPTLIKDLNEAGFQSFKDQLWETAKALGNLLQNHFYKENNILFPAALSVITEQEWVEIRKEFDEIGYCCFTPPELISIVPSTETVQASTQAPEGILQFETGSLTKDQLDSLINALPVDITFIDENDTVRYFNKPEKRFFVRTKAVIGRKVQMCHPQKSLNVVTMILDSFKAGKKDVAEFWITLNEQLIHIRFFAVRDNNGKYVGTMEVVQDITKIRKIEGERRLLDWKE